MYNVRVNYQLNANLKRDKIWSLIIIEVQQ